MKKHQHAEWGRCASTQGCFQPKDSILCTWYNSNNTLYSAFKNTSLLTVVKQIQLFPNCCQANTKGNISCISCMQSRTWQRRNFDSIQSLGIMIPKFQAMLFWQLVREISLHVTTFAIQPYSNCTLTPIAPLFSHNSNHYQHDCAWQSLLFWSLQHDITTPENLFSSLFMSERIKQGFNSQTSDSSVLCWGVQVSDGCGA